MKSWNEIPYWTRFAQDDLVELRLINRETRSVRRRFVAARWLGGVDGSGVHSGLNQNGWEVYAGVNPRTRHGGSSESDVAKVVAFHVDIDGKREWTPATGVPEPSMIVDSGGGLHAYWFLASALTVTNENRELLKNVNRGLAYRLNGDHHAIDLSRILRVPGFVNHKRGVPVSVVSFKPELRYDLGDFLMIADLSQTPALPKTHGQVIVEVSELDDELRERFAQTRKKVKGLSKFWRGEVGDGSSDSRFGLVNQLHREGYTNDEIASIVLSRTWWNRKTGVMREAEHVKRHVERVLEAI